MTNNNNFLTEVSPAVSAMELPVLNLAYMGDAVFEVMVRTAILNKYNKSPGQLHKAAKEYVNAAAQSEMYYTLCEYLSEEEMAVMKRGRNAKSQTKAKNASIIDYRRATGLETLFGYLYISNNTERLVELFNICVRI